ncbi:MAG: DUF2949 domain-containing protein [Spirulinaceae cyanobacterium]
MPPVTYSRFLNFLENELAISQDSIAIAQRYTDQHPGSLPMVLWKYGLVTLEQLDQIFDWLETA